MNRYKIKWLIILILAISSLIGYGIYNRNVIFGKKIDIENLEVRVNNYINRIDSNLKVSEIIIYSDTNYYFSIEEKDTAIGAMELLVNPYTGSIRPEQGPNMMWNTKYRMMGRNIYYNNDEINNIKLTRNEALIKAKEYVKNNLNTNYNVSDEGREYNGYFTFHIEENDTIVGMLSVNSYTGDVWYHNWHGSIVNIITFHDEE